MFPRIVSQLSLSPQALSEIAFYARRLRQERVTRTFSAIAAVMILLLQFLTIAVPPTPTNAASTNDVYYGGFVSRIDLLNRYDENASLRNLYTSYFGISRADIANATATTISSKDRSLHSVGREQHTASDTEIHTADNTYYGRPLYVWDTGANVSTGSSYSVLQGTTAKGAFWAIIFHCGNVVYKTLPAHASPSPVTQTPTVVNKVPQSSGCLSPTDATSFTTSFTRGTGTISTTGGLALCKPANLVLESFTISDTWDGHGFNASTLPQVKFATTNVTLPANEPTIKATLNVPVPSNCKNTQLDFYFLPAYDAITTLHTDDARYIGGKIFAASSACTVVTPTPAPIPTVAPKITPKPTPIPAVACSKLTANITTGPAPLNVNFTGAAQTNGLAIDEYQFDLGDQHALTSRSAVISYNYMTAGTYTATLAVAGSNGTASAGVPSCSVKITVTAPPAIYVKNKSAQNLTTNRDATIAPAQGGDQIRYTLATKNAGGVLGDYSVVEHVDDILEYATITDTGGATLEKGVLTWPTATITPGTTLLKNFVVTIKNPVPSTPIGVSDRFSYDLRLDNIYGNLVSIAVAPPTAKQIEGASSSLPATGAATSTLIILGVALLALYFYFRNRQLITEVRILRGTYQGGL